MKKTSIFLLLVSALLVSGTMWAGMVPPIDEGKLPFKQEESRPILTERPKLQSNNIAARKVSLGDEVMVAQIGSKQYSTVQAAFDDVPVGQETTVTLLCNATEPADLCVYGGKNIKLDLNNKTLTFATGKLIEISYNPNDSNYLSTNNDQLSIFNGTIETTYNGIYNYGALNMSDVTINDGNYSLQNLGGVVTINSGTYGYIYNSGVGEINGGSFSGFFRSLGELVINNGIFGKYIDNYGELTINNGIFNGVIYSNETDDVININNGTFNTTVYHTGGIMNITGGTFEAGNSSNYVYGGTLNISGGTFTSSYKYGTFYLWNYYHPIKVNITGSPVFVCENDGTETWTAGCFYGYTNDVISIKGGTFISNNIVFYARNSQYVIEGGSFHRAPGYTFYAGTSGSILLKGGKANTNERAYFASYIAPGYALSKPEDGWYSVVKSVVTLNGVGYPSIAAALEDAKSGESIMLIDDIIGDVDITKSVQIVLANKSISGCLTASNNSNVFVHGTSSSDVGSFAASAGSSVKIDRGSFTNKPDDQYIADGYMTEEVGGKWKVTAGEIIALNIDGGNTIKCTSFKAALDSIKVAGNKPSLITFLKNFADEGGNIIESEQDITIDLNGCKMSSASQPNDTYALINNKGTLTIKDSKDTNRKGLGGGELQTSDLGADMKFCPRYATNVITNYGTIYMESGRLTSFGEGQASYAVDNQAPHSAGDVKLIVTGGQIISEGSSNAIRMYLSSENNNVIDIQNANVSSIWAQDADANSMGYLNVENSTINKGLSLGYAGATTHATKLTVHLKNDTIENGSFNSIIDLDPLSLAQDTTFSFDNCRFKTYIHSDYFKHLTNGQFQFKEDVFKAYGRNSTMMAEYPESEGYYYKPLQGTENYVQVYRHVEANFREFVQYIMDGYYLVLMDGKDGENLWYEIRPLKVSLKEPQAQSAEQDTLGSPWHKPTTWDATEGASVEVVPKSNEAVLIDHNVYVEKDTKDAVANSIVIDSAKTLTVQSGAVLTIGDGGIWIKDDYAKIIIEPNAIVTVGSNGIMADNVDNIYIQSSKEGTGVMLISPGVTINTHPAATVEMYTKAHKVNATDYNWQHFGIPTNGAADYITVEPFVDTWLNEWTDAKWTMISDVSDMNVPFRGYNLTNANDTAGTTYTFVGNIIGNGDGSLHFYESGYNVMGNSYTGPIDIAKVLDSLPEGIEATVWIYDSEKDRHISTNSYLISIDEADFVNIAPMQGFIMNLTDGENAEGEIDYVEAVWNNPDKTSIPLLSPGRKSTQTGARIVLSANGSEDVVRLYEDAKYTQDFDNGADATKFIGNSHFQMYASQADNKLGIVVADNLDGTFLSLQADDNNIYEMSFQNVNNFDYVLRDMQTGKDYAIVEGVTYTFAATANTTSENRFQIIAANHVTTGIENAGIDKNDKGVYTVLGQYLCETNQLHTLPAGVYVVDGQKICK